MPQKNIFELLQTPVQFIKGVGPYLSQKLSFLGLNTLEDILYHFPQRYEDRRFVSSIKQLQVGEKSLVCAKVLLSGEIPLGRSKRKLFEVLFQDATGSLSAKWFHISSHLKKQFEKGKWAYLSGKVENYRGQKQIIHPELEWLEEGEEQSEREEKILALYALTEGLSQKQIRKIVQAALHLIQTLPEQALESLPHALQDRFEFNSFQSFLQVHHPLLNKDEGLQMYDSFASQAHQRLLFDEFFYLELGLLLKKMKIKKERAPEIKVSPGLQKEIFSSLPFELTAAQQNALTDIENDFKLGEKMNRLIQGDVGSGKTMVAFISMLWVALSGFQACLMVPTEILAEQHFINLQKFLSPFQVSFALLKSDLPAALKRQTLEEIAQGKISIVVGTHALIQESVRFKQLSYVVIDEQHRFGVMQRAQLKDKGLQAHQLIMTATPIPRTLTMTLYGDLDVSLIKELPKGRQPIYTRLVEAKDQPKMFEFIRDQIAKGRQAYFVYPLIENSEKLPLKNATEMAEKLKNEIFPEFEIGLMHGQMKSEEKERVTKDFKEGRLHVLVATTVIEVGVDVPNASMMIIEQAERFGLSQLHQIRGRVGRGSHKSYCFLIAGWPRSEEAKARLNIICEHQDGFRISEEDLKIRGPGDFLGTRQTGLPDFRIVNLLRDQECLNVAKKEAEKWLSQIERHSAEEKERVWAWLKYRWKGRLNLAEVS